MSIFLGWREKMGCEDGRLENFGSVAPKEVFSFLVLMCRYFFEKWFPIFAWEWLGRHRGQFNSKYI